MAVYDDNTGEELVESMEQTANLSQNIPNPFSLETLVSCFVPASSRSAAIRVYGLDGRIVEELPLMKTGRQEIVINKGKLSPGVYIYSLIIDGQAMAIRKLAVSQ